MISLFYLIELKKTKINCFRNRLPQLAPFFLTAIITKNDKNNSLISSERNYN